MLSIDYNNVNFLIFFLYLSNDDDDCISKIKLNKLIIIELFNNKLNCKKFIQKLINVIIEKEKNF